MRIEDAALKFFRQNFPARQVRIPDLKNYLKDKGWTDVSKKDVITKFKSPTYNIFVFVPEQDDLEDYERAVEIVIEVVSSFEGRKFEDVFKDIVTGKYL